MLLGNDRQLVNYIYIIEVYISLNYIYIICKAANKVEKTTVVYISLLEFLSKRYGG